MRTIDKIRPLAVDIRDGRWYVNCGKTNTPLSVHRLIGIDFVNHRVLDDSPIIPINAGYKYYWFVAHMGGAYELYDVRFSLPKVASDVQMLYVALSNDPVNFPDDTVGISLQELARRQYERPRGTRG